MARRGWIGSLLAVTCLVAAACNGDDEPGASTTVPATAPTESPTTVGAVATTTTTTTSVVPTTGPPPTTPVPTATATTLASNPVDPAEAEALAAWDAWWAAITNPATTQDQLAALADPAAIETVEGLGTQFWQGAPFQRFAFATVIDGGATIEDCALGGGGIVIDDQVATVPGRDASMRFIGTFVAGRSGLRLTEFELADRGCVPAPIAEAALAGWATSLAALAEVLLARDPADSRIDQVATAEYRNYFVSLVQRSVDENFLIRRGEPVDRYPVVAEYRSPTEVLISECSSQNPANGVFDATTGSRRDDLEAAPDPSLQGADEPTMTLVDGVWKVSSRRSSVNAECELDPTDFGLTLVGSP